MSMTQYQMEKYLGLDEHAGESRITANPKSKQVGGTHYSKMKIQPVDYIYENELPYLEGNVIKYVSRHRSKNGIEDINKAIHYLELIKEKVYGSRG